MSPRFTVHLDALAAGHLIWAVVDEEARVIRSRWERLADAQLDRDAREVFESFGCEIAVWVS